ncbi:DUF1294 domain-containing protein [Patescibacteria group bacterium]
MNGEVLSVVLFFVIVNLIAFFSMMIDKIQSRKSGSTRISEGLLFFMATFFGSVGVYTGMFTFRHKTRKWYFIIGIPLLVLQNISFLYIVYSYLREIVDFIS